MRTHTITFPNKVGHIDEVAKRLAKSIANQGIQLKIDELGLLWELLHACGAEQRHFSKSPVSCPKCEGKGVVPVRVDMVSGKYVFCSEEHKQGDCPCPMCC